MISRRALFGLSVGAMAGVVVKLPAAPTEVIVGLDFGKERAAAVIAQRFPREWMLDFTDAYFFRSPREPPVERWVDA